MKVEDTRSKVLSDGYHKVRVRVRVNGAIEECLVNKRMSLNQ